MQCVSCAAPLPSEAKFCLRCGAPATDGATLEKPDPQRAALVAALGRGFEVVGFLGRGGMGAVYRARETFLERDVAIKVLPPERASTGEARERFRREARTAARLSHPNIVPLHTFGDADGMLFFVMGFVKGESLAARLRREERLPPEEIRRILSEVADALDYAHRQGVVHRDIKPDNILIDEESGRPMLTDFGIAKATGSSQTLTELGAVVGTPSFMSPEQASGKTLDGRSDIYSLGVMGYQMASGRLPFEGDARDILLQHLTKEPEPLARTAPELPGDMAATIQRCLAKDPVARWPDAKALRQALGSPLAGHELPESLERVEGWGFWLAGAAATLAFIVQGLAAGVPLTMKWYRSTQLSLWGMAVVALATVVLAFLLVLLERARVARSEGIAWRQILRVALRPPRWWPAWYPRPFRRPGDVWLRLPTWVRLYRTWWFSWGVLFAMAVSALIAGILRGSFGGAASSGDRWAAAAFFLQLDLFPLVYAAAFFFWGRRRGLSASDLARLCSEPTTPSRFWTKPQIVAALLPETAGGPAQPRSAQELLRAIARLAQAATGAGREASANGLAGARALVAALAAIDRQLAHLEGSVDPEEMARLERKLAALGEPASADGGEQMEVHALLSKQLESARRLSARLHEKRSERERLLDFLKRLWLELGGEQPSAGLGPEVSVETDARIRSLCAEIERCAGTSGATPAGSAGIEERPTLPR